MNIRITTIALVCTLLAACATTQQPPSDRPQPPLPVTQVDPRTSSQGVDLNEAADDADALVTEPEVDRGTGEFIDRDAASRRAPAVSADGEINLNFEAEPIQEVVHLILGEILQENFVISPGVDGEITFATARPVSRDQLMPLLEMMLRQSNATLVYGEGRYTVLPLDQAAPGNLVPRVGSAESAKGYEVRAVPLDYISPSQMEVLLEPYARDGAILNADDSRSLLVIGGTRQELRNYLQTIEIFDVDWLEGMSVGLYPVNRVEVATLVPELEAIFGADAESPLAGMFRFVPMERLNSVMVITPQPAYLDQAEEWITKLDRGGSEASSRLYTYRVQNLEAAVLAGYLSDLFGGSGNNRRQQGGQVGPNLEPVSLNNFNNRGGQGSGAAGAQGSDANRGQNRGPTSVTLGENNDIRITAVIETNSLLIQASPQRYESILAAIKRLDEEPLQVHVETQIVEVVLNDNLEYGVNWFLSNEPVATENLPGGFVGTRDENFGQILSGEIFTSITRRALDRTFVAATINLLDSVSDTRILSAPSLMIRNNEEASINVGEALAVQSTSFNPTTGGTGTIASNQYIQTGVQLTVTPRVNPGGLVYLDINQEVSSPSATLGPNGNPNINERSLNTKIAVQSGQTILLGGLIRDQLLEGSSGVPVLHKIPVLGALFGERRKNLSRTELLLLITPTVVQTSTEMREVTEEYQKKFRSVRPIQDENNQPIGLNN